MEHTASQLCSLRLPENMPVMVLDDCYLFPGCFLPLYIFEERYRAMLACALDTDRMFCIGSRERGVEDGPLAPVSTAAIIRACRKQTDGTSHVMLYGITRIRFTNWTQERPFRIATITPEKTTWSSSMEELAAMKAHLLTLLPKPAPKCSEAMQVLRATLESRPCVEMVCDILAYHFVRDPAMQRTLLTEPVLEQRYQLLVRELEALHPNG